MPWQNKQPDATITWRDSTDTSAVMAFHVRSGVEAVAAHTGIAGMRGLFVPITGCVPVRQAVTYSSLNGERPDPDVGIEAWREGVFIFDTVEPGQYAVLRIPGLLPSLLVTTGCGAGLDIDQTRPAVAALVEALLTGDWCNPWGYALLSLRAAYMQVNQ